MSHHKKSILIYKASLPVCAVVLVTFTDVKLTVGAQDAQRGLITQLTSIDITVAAYHWKTVRILLIGWQGKTRANHNVEANPFSLQVTGTLMSVLRMAASPSKGQNKPKWKKWQDAAFKAYKFSRMHPRHPRLAPSPRSNSLMNSVCSLSPL